MASTARATGYLELNISGFEEAIKSAKKALAGLAATFLTFKTAQYFTNGIRDAITFGKEMKIVGDRMGGFNPGNLLLAQKALEQIGYSAEEAQSKIGEFVHRSLPIKEIFGGEQKYGKALERAGETYGKQAEILNRSATSFQMIWNTLQSIGSRTMEFFLTLAEKFVKPLAIVADYLNSPVFSKAAEKIGNALRDGAMFLIGIISNGDLANGLASVFKFAYLQSKETLIEGFWEATDFLTLAFENISQIFTDNILGTKTKGVLFFIFQSAADYFASKLLLAGAKLVELFRQIPGLGNIKDPFSEDAKTSAERAAGGLDQIGLIIDSIDFKQIADDVGTGLLYAGEEAGRNQRRGDNKVFGSQEGIDKAWNDMMGIGNRAFVKAEELFKKTKEDNDPFKGSFQQPGTGKVIADSLAKVGGGGGFLRVGMTLTERTAVESLKAQKESNEIQKRIENNTSKGEKPTTMVR
jgi:phage FluMu protein gp41